MNATATLIDDILTALNKSAKTNETVDVQHTVTLKFQYSVTVDTITEYWVDAENEDSSNPVTLIKRYDSNGSLKSLTLFDEECNIVHDFRYNKRAYARMTDRVTGKVCKPSKTYEFMGVSLMLKCDLDY